jgi:hypothetical protein
MCKSIITAAFMTAVLSIAAVANGQEFTLMAGATASKASIQGNTLEILASGRLHTYTRKASLDSADGQFAGFYNASLRKGLRFPVSGRGNMQTQDAYGTWKSTLMTVQPASVASGRSGSGTPRIDSIIDIVDRLTDDRKPKGQAQPAQRPQRQKNAFEGTWKFSHANGSAVLKFGPRKFKLTQFNDWDEQIGAPVTGTYALAWKQVRGRVKVLKINTGNGANEVSFTFSNNKSELELFDTTWTRK